MRIYMLLLAIAGMPATALACVAGEAEVFSCMTTDGKTAQVCQAADSIRYTFGREGAAPEMTIAVPNSNFVWHSDGGSAMDTTDLNFDSGGTRYVVSATRYRDEDPPLDAVIRALRGGADAASHTCRDNSVRLVERAITKGKTAY